MLGGIVGAASGRPQMNLSRDGEIVQAWIKKISDKYLYVNVDRYVIMPNHVHMILFIHRLEHDKKIEGRHDIEYEQYDIEKGRHDIEYGQNDVENGRPNAASTATLGKIIGYFKYQTTKEIDIDGFWQRSYHDRIIRGEAEYQKILQYIEENPARWQQDRYILNSKKTAVMRFFVSCQANNHCEHVGDDGNRPVKIGCIYIESRADCHPPLQSAILFLVLIFRIH